MKVAQGDQTCQYLTLLHEVCVILKPYNSSYQSLE